MFKTVVPFLVRRFWGPCTTQESVERARQTMLWQVPKRKSSGNPPVGISPTAVSPVRRMPVPPGNANVRGNQLGLSLKGDQPQERPEDRCLLVFNSSIRNHIRSSLTWLLSSFQQKIVLFFSHISGYWRTLRLCWKKTSATRKKAGLVQIMIRRRIPGEDGVDLNHGRLLQQLCLRGVIEVEQPGRRIKIVLPD